MTTAVHTPERTLDAYAAIATWVREDGSAILFPDERETLRSAADALVFGDEEYDRTRDDAIALVDSLLERDRIGVPTAARLRGWLIALNPVV